MRNLFVGNLNFRTTENELSSFFEPVGEIASLRVITDRDTGRSRGFAFVEMATDEAAAKAVTELNGKELDGRALNVNEARPKPERSNGSNGSNGSFGARGYGQRRENSW